MKGVKNMNKNKTFGVIGVCGANGNLIARIIYELILITVMIWKNTAEIKKSLKK